MKYYHAERGGNGIAPPIIKLSARRGWVVNTTTRPPYPQEKRNITHRTAGWDSRPMWTSKKISPPLGFKHQ